MTKKIVITVVSILAALAATVIIACFAVFLINRHNAQKLQAGLENFAIHQTDDITIFSFDDNIGLWGDQSLNLSTQKDFDQFVDENLNVPVTITDESDSQSSSNPEVSWHVIKFEYISGNQKIFGRFTVNSNSETNYVSLKING